MRFVALLVLCLALFGCNRAQDTGAVQEIPARKAPVFTGTDQDGRQFSSSELQGKPWLASFFFTTCQSVCPMLNAKQKELVSRFGDKMHFVSISTDPTVDTGATLAAYAKEYGAVAGTWWMLNINEPEMRKLSTEGFLLMDPKEPAMHSSRLVAVDASGMIRGYYDSGDSADIQKLTQWISSQL